MADQADGIFGAVFAVGVHDEDRIARDVILKMAQAHGDGALVSQVAAEVQDIESVQVLRDEWVPARDSVRAAVVFQHGLVLDALQLGALQIERAAEERSRFPVAVDRHQNHDTEWRAGVHEIVSQIYGAGFSGGK